MEAMRLGRHAYVAVYGQNRAAAKAVLQHNECQALIRLVAGLPLRWPAPQVVPGTWCRYAQGADDPPHDPDAGRAQDRGHPGASPTVGHGLHHLLTVHGTLGTRRPGGRFVQEWEPSMHGCWPDEGPVHDPGGDVLQ